MKVLNREGIIRMGGRSQGGGGVSVGGGSGSVAGLASEAWVEENYLSKAFFNRLFCVYNANDEVIEPNDPDEEEVVDNIKALVGFWTDDYLSALGIGSGGGGGGITLNEPLSSINSQGLNAPSTAGSALVWYNGAWTYSPSARLQVAGLNSSAAVSVTGSVTATSFVRQGGTSSMFLKADGSVDTTVYAAQDWVSQNFITIAFFETLFNAVDTNGTKVNANTTTGIDSIKAMFGFWTNQYLSALGQGSGGGGGGVTLNQPLSSINSAGLGAPSVSGSTLVWNGTTWTYSSSIGDTKNTAGSSAQPSGVQLYLIGASAQATWGVTYSNSGCYIGTDGYLYSGGSKVLTSSSGFVTGVSVNNGNPISPVNGVVALTDIMTTAGGTMTGSLSISGSGNHLSVGGNIGAQGTITSQDYITATGYKVPSGISAGFLKADGSVDTTSYSERDTLNTAGATAQPNSVIYLVGAGSYNSTYAVTYTNSGCYISADGYLYSGGVKVITSTSGLVSGISIGGDTPIEPTNGIVQIPAYPVNTDTLNTTGSTQKPSNVALYLVGASAQATYGQTYSDSGCYISADGYLYSGGVRVLTSGNTVQTITINNGTPVSPTNGNININCVTSVTSSTVTTALGFTPAASSDLANYLPLSGGTLTGKLTVKAVVFGYNYNAAGNNAAAFVFDKPGSYYTGIGSHATSDIIYFGACDVNGNWEDDYKQTWTFNGSVGIGTTGTLSYNLDVLGTAQFGSNSKYKVRLGSSSTYAGISMVDSGGTSRGILNLYSDYLRLGVAAYKTVMRGNTIEVQYGSSSNVGLYMGSDGKVGIGTSSPSYKLHVGGNFGVDSSIECHDLTVSTGSGSTGSASIATDLTVGSHVYVEKIGNGMTNMRFNSNGNVGIGVNNTSGYLLQVNGAVAGTSWTNLSDMRQKNYIEDKTLDLSQVAHAPIFKFTWKNIAFGTGLHIGTSAQYWQTITPEAVTTDGIGNLGLQYDVVALLAAVTTAKKVEDHEREIAELNKKYEGVLRENAEIRSMIELLKAS